MQATGVTNQAYAHGPDRLLLLGYHDETGVFAAWDPSKHDNLDEHGSNSLFVPLSTLEDAARDGMSSNAYLSRARSEPAVVVAFRPEVAHDYLTIFLELRPDDAQSVQAVAVAASGGVAPLVGLDEVRQRVVSTVSRAYRDANFRLEVMAAYGGKCAFCGLMAGLPQAAHIKGVEQGGPDHVTNGLAACPTHHLAFDRGLLLVADDFTVSVHRPPWSGVGDLELAALRASVGHQLLVPANVAARPDPRFLAAHRAKFT